LILLCLLIVARSALWLVGVSGPALTAWDFLWRPGLVVGLVFLFINCCYENELMNGRAHDLLTQGWGAERAIEHVKVRENLGRVMYEYPYTPTWCEAVGQEAYFLKKLGKHEEAIALYKTLLGGLGSCIPAPSLLRQWHNECFDACDGLAECYEAKGDYRNALRYARLKQSAYRYNGGCGTCIDELRKELKLQIARLQGLAVAKEP
jgi:hypothetical protein